MAKAENQFNSKIWSCDIFLWNSHLTSYIFLLWYQHSNFPLESMTNAVDFLVRLLGFRLSFIMKFNQWNNNKHLLIYFVDQKFFLISTQIVFFSCSMNVNLIWLLVELEFIDESEKFTFMALFWLCNEYNVSYFDCSSFYS